MRNDSRYEFLLNDPEQGENNRRLLAELKTPQRAAEVFEKPWVKEFVGNRAFRLIELAQLDETEFKHAESLWEQDNSINITDLLKSAKIMAKPEKAEAAAKSVLNWSVGRFLLGATALTTVFNISRLIAPTNDIAAFLMPNYDAFFEDKITYLKSGALLQENLTTSYIFASYEYRFNQQVENLTDSQEEILYELMENKDFKRFTSIYPEKIKLLLGMEPEQRTAFVSNALLPQSPYQILLRDTLVAEKSFDINSAERSDFLKEKLSGPWNINPRAHEIFNDIGQNQNLDTLMRCLALDNLKDKTKPIIYIPYLPCYGGLAMRSGEIFIDSTDIDNTHSILTHEMGHRGLFITNDYSSAAPFDVKFNASYYTFRGIQAPRANPEKEEMLKGQRLAFNDAMIETLANLKQLNKDISSLATSSINLRGQRDPRSTHAWRPKGIEESILFSFQTGLLYGDWQSDIDEFAVKLPEILGQIKELPPHIRDAIKPLANYYKQYITPRWLDYIETHSQKELLLPGDIDRYHPETVMNRSGEDELLAKKVLSENEAILVGQITTMENLLQGKDTAGAVDLLSSITDERVLRATLKASIEHNQPALFDDALAKLEAKQHLGPQLLLAAQMDRKEMVNKLLPQVNSQYHIAKVVELGVERGDKELMDPAMARITNRWFLLSSLFKAKGTAIEPYFMQAALAKPMIDNTYSTDFSGRDEAQSIYSSKIIYELQKEIDSSLSENIPLYKEWRDRVSSSSKKPEIIEL